MSNTDSTKKPGETQVLAKGKQFLLLKRHPPCYAYIQASHGADGGRKTSTQNVKDPLSFEIWIFRNSQRSE